MEHGDFADALGEVTAPMSRRALVDALVKLAYYYDEPTGVHLDAVGSLSRWLATELGYDAELVDRVEFAARLHDIGKQTIPRAILLKPSSLTKDEWEVMRRHPDHGANIIRCFEPLAPLADIVRSHHERLDGTGYPDGRVGLEIAIEARIIAVADAFHAMTVSRPYVAARSPGGALLELQRCAGTQFDAECVDAFVAMLGGRRTRPALFEAPESPQSTRPEIERPPQRRIIA